MELTSKVLPPLDAKAPRKRERITVRLAQDKAEVMACKQLRYQVFISEMGASSNNTNAISQGIDEDRFDDYCEHLIAIDNNKDRVAGTYRILSAKNAMLCGGWYSETEFDISPIRHIAHQMVEVGRSCVHPDYRNGSTIAKLWSGLARYMIEGDYQYLLGCASIPVGGDGGSNAARILKYTRSSLAPDEFIMTPLRCWKNPDMDNHLESTSGDNGQKAAKRKKNKNNNNGESRYAHGSARSAKEVSSSSTGVRMPPLLKGYLNAGAWICGDPAYDPEFKTADVLILLPLANVTDKHARHFLQRN